MGKIRDSYAQNDAITSIIYSFNSRDSFKECYGQEKSIQWLHSSQLLSLKELCKKQVIVTERKICLTINFTILIYFGFSPSSPTYQDQKRWFIRFQALSAENLHFINSIFSSPITEDAQGGSYDKYIRNITVKCNTLNHKSQNLL